MLSVMPKAKQLLADKGYDADWFRAPPSPSAASPLHSFQRQPQNRVIPHDAVLYKQRHKIENMFGRLGRLAACIHTRYDRCAHTYFSAICIAAAVIFWL